MYHVVQKPVENGHRQQWIVICSDVPVVGVIYMSFIL